jgi:N-acetylglucosamine kinase-like BadF-type ATPase
MCLIVGLDGGGTKTRCAVSDGTGILGRGLSGGCNIVRLGEAAARSSIHEAMRQAFAAAGIEASQVEAVCIGVAGSAVLHVRQAVESIIGEVVSCPVRVVGDEEIAFEAFFSGAPGVLVIAGTGSIAFGRNAAGEIAHAGGHGFIISDEGSGQWIGRTAVSECLRALDAGLDCELMPLLLTAFGVRTAGELIEAANAVPLADFSRLLPVVLKAVEDGDPIACQVLSRAGDELASIAKAVAAKLGMPEQELRIALAGGVFEHCELVRREFERALHRSHPQSVVAGQVREPLLGALTLAAVALAREAESATA